MMSPKNDDATGGVNWLREDMKEIREHMTKTAIGLASLTTSVEGIGNKIDAHCQDPRAHLLPDSSTSLVPPSRRRGVSVTQVARTYGPFLLAAAIGLLGLGAYFGSGGDMAATQKTIQQIGDTTAQLAKEIESVRTAMNAEEK
jgi:hypothetical protein